MAGNQKQNPEAEAKAKAAAAEKEAKEKKAPEEAAAKVKGATGSAEMLAKGHLAIEYTGTIANSKSVMVEVPGEYRTRRFDEGVPVVLPEKAALAIVDTHRGAFRTLTREDALKKLRKEG